MINFIKWGLNRDVDAIFLVFMWLCIFTGFGWFIAGMVLLLSSHQAWGLAVLITPIAYLIYKMWNIYAKETNK